MKVTVFCNRASLCNRDGRRNTAVRLPGSEIQRCYVSRLSRRTWAPVPGGTGSDRFNEIS